MLKNGRKSFYFFLIRQLPNIVKTMSILYILLGHTIQKAEYDRISLLIIQSSARFRENCENRLLVVKLPSFVSLLPRNVDVVLQMQL